MAYSPSEKYPGAVDVDPDYQGGKFRDNNPSTTNNGSPLKAIDRNELLARDEAIMNDAGFEYSGVADTPQDSQLFKAYKASLGNGANLLSNHNFLIQTPDDSQPLPSATPTSYPPGYQIFSGVFANETTGITNLTYIDGRVSFSGGDLYFAVPNTGGVERLTSGQLTASVADFDGKPRTRGVSFALVGDDYRVTVGVDALEDVSATLTPLGSVKFEQGSVATRHESIELLTVKAVGDLTNYQAGNVADMIAGRTVSGAVENKVGDYWSSGGSKWKRKALSNPSTIYDFDAYDTFNVLDNDVVGDGVTNTSATLQALVDLAYEIFKFTGNPQTLYFPPGHTYVFRLVTNKPGVNWFSHGAKFLKTPAGSETDENVLKNWRMVTHSQSDFVTDLDLSHRIRFSGIVFDGNLDNMNWTDNTYNQEQAHCLFVIGNSAPTSAERRAKFQVDNCHFQNSVADGLSQYYNSDLIARDITADNCFRGGMVSTGGNSRINLDGYIGENARFDIEVDGAGVGGSYRLDSVIKNVIIDADGGGLRPGGIDIGYTDGGTFIGDNIQCFTSPFNAIGQIAGLKGKKLLVTNSYFTTGQRSATGNRFIKPINAKFVDTEFFCSNDNAVATEFDGIQVTFSLGGEDVFNEAVTFDSCDFSADDSIPAAHRISGIYSPTNVQSNGNKIIVRGDSRISRDFLYGYHLAQGGYIKHDSGRIDAQTAFWCDYSGSTRFFTIDVGKIDRDSEFTVYLKSNTAISATGNTLIHRETILDSSKNVFDAAGTKDIANVIGGRILHGATAPTAGQPGWNGDKYRLSTPVAGTPYEWVATNTAWSATATWSTVGNLL